MAYFLLFILQSSLLVLVVMGIRILGKKKLSPVFVYALWLVPMLRFLIPFGGIGISGTSGYGKYLMMPVYALESATEKIGYGGEGEDAAAEESNSVSISYLPEEQVHTIAIPNVEDNSVHSYTEYTYVTSEGVAGIDTAADETTYIYGDADKSEPLPFSGGGAQNVLSYFLCIWLTGTAFLAEYTWKKNRQFIRMVKGEGKPLEVGEGHCPLMVYKAAGLSSPCLIGVRKPFIAVNEKAAADEKVLSYVLLHETAHYKQKDHIWTLIRNLLCIIYWWNPLVWKGTECCAMDAELACDRRVTAGMSAEQKKEYGNALLTLADGSRKSERLYQATTIMSTKSTLRRRIESIAATGTASRGVSVITAAAIVLTAVGCSMQPMEAAAQVKTSVYVTEEQSQIPEAAEEQADSVTEKSVYAEEKETPLEKQTEEGAASLDYENPELDYIIFHTEQKIYIFDMVRKNIVREVGIKDREQQPVSLKDSRVEVSDDGMWVYIKPDESEEMYSYSLRYHTVYLVPAKEIQESYNKQQLVGEILWDEELTECIYRNIEGEYLLFAGENAGQMTEYEAQEPKWFDDTITSGTFYYDLRQRAVTLNSFVGSYVQMLNLWDYAGVCRLSEGVDYEEDVRKVWRGIEGSVTADYVGTYRGQYCLRLTMDITRPGDSEFKEGKNERYLCVRFGADRYGNKCWYADGGMKEEEVNMKLWYNHIFADGER